jgi:hypothetical protein
VALSVFFDWGADTAIQRIYINNVVNFSPLSPPLASGKGMLDAHPLSDFPLSHGLFNSLYHCPLPDYPNVPLFIVPSSHAPPSLGFIVPLSIVSVSTVRSKCLSAPLSSARVPHSRIVRCPIVLSPVVPQSTVRVSIVRLSLVGIVPLSHCCIALRPRGLQARVRRDLFCVRHSSRDMICASVRHAELDHK